jgi:hypothetical protein
MAGSPPNNSPRMFAAILHALHKDRLSVTDNVGAEHPARADIYLRRATQTQSGGVRTHIRE